ncbi:glycosyltransferase family 2 protein [Promicromonospora sp. Populi]|uniref:glycosyltransferase family 2 protein n=1 Tax=Promicromonospora sp. Populi TaxID=3239420 RepID=UPI0034E1CA66
MGTPGARVEQTPLLSVVVPVYGVERYLDDCLNSILGQGVPQEIIVVVDGSPDRSVVIAREFAAAYDEVRVVENPVNVGLGAARNIGLGHARGTYVTFPDSDDIVAPGAYAALVASLERSGSDFATAYADEFGTSSGRHRYWTTRPAVYDTGAEGVTLADFPELVYDHTAWTKVFRREFLVHQDIRWPEATKCEDVVPSMRAYASAAAFDVVPQCLYLYRRRPGSITTGLASTRTILEWAVQVREALRVLKGADVPEAVQLFVEKVLRYEVASRIKPLSVADGETRATVASFVAELLEASDAATLRRVQPATVTAALELLGRTEPETPSPAPAAHGAPTANAGPMISVVLPTFDVGPWIDACIGSVLAQTMGDLELIVVDDHSTDGTWEKVLDWARRDTRVVAVRNPGSGGAQARNAGLELAAGRYVIFCDGDDLVPRHAYRSLLDLAEHSGADVTVGGFQRVWTSTTWSDPGMYGLDRRLERTTLDLNPRLIRNRTCWNRLIRREFWAEHKLHFPTTPRGNDMLPMTAAMLFAQSIAVTPEVVYHYRARPGGSSMTARLGDVRSLIGYFVQERLCAVLVADDDRSMLAREYWHAALGSDAWATLGKLLRDGLDDLGKEDRAAVSDAVAGLVLMAPFDALERIGARRALVFHLAAHGHLDLARIVWEREVGKRPAGAPDTISALAEALSTAMANGIDRRLVGRIWRDEVMRPFIDAAHAWDDELAERLMVFASRVDPVVPLRSTAAPATREVRVAEALLHGEVKDVWREAQRNPYKYRPKFAATVAGLRGRVLHLRGDGPVRPGVRVLRLEALGSEGKRRDVHRQRLFGQVSVTEAGWFVDADLAALEPGYDWRLRVVVEDAFGELELPVRIQWPGRTSSLSVVRPMRIAGDQELGLRTFASGPARVATAVRWRSVRVGRRAKQLRVYRAVEWRILRARKIRQKAALQNASRRDNA